MQRELKFRVWSGKTFLKADDFCLFPEDNGDFLPRRIGEYGSLHHIENAVIQQSTGLQDSEGKDIYEGDILEYNPDSCSLYKGQKDCTIVWSKHGVAGWMIESKQGGFSWSLSKEFCSQYVKIIGNIFETPQDSES